MPNKPRDHEDSRRVVCVLCFSKCLKGRIITEKQEEQIQTLIPGFLRIDSLFPTVICDHCRIKMTKNPESIESVDYKHLQTKPSRSVRCLCNICEVASLNNKENNKFSFKIATKKLTARPLLCPKCYSPVGNYKF